MPRHTGYAAGWPGHMKLSLSVNTAAMRIGVTLLDYAGLVLIHMSHVMKSSAKKIGQ